MVEKKIMGSLHLNGLPMIPSSLCQSDTTISIGDTTPGRELQWVPDGDRLIADRCICFNVSWQQLNKQGLVFGTPVVIDGQPYMCRCLKVGKTQGVPNEWDDLLDRTGNKDEVWHWKAQLFWGQEALDTLPSFNIIRGGKSSGRFEAVVSIVNIVSIGFRPILEPLPLPYPTFLLLRERRFGCMGRKERIS